MYSNVFDTVKNSDVDLINFEGLIYSSIISGLHPTFSLNQAIDSTALFNIIDGHPEFLELIRQNYIRVALFGKYTGEKNEIISFLQNNLNECTVNDDSAFKFSCLPFLYTGNYTKQQQKKIYKKMLDMLNSQTISFDTYTAKNIGMDLNANDHFKIENYLLNVRKMSEAVNDHYILPVNRPKAETLYDKVLNDIHILCAKSKNPKLKSYAKELKKELKRQKKNSEYKRVINKRSNMYNVIEATCSSKHEEMELKSLVDLCYNEIVAESIADNEDDIIINSNNYEYAQIYEKSEDNNVDRADQELSLIRNSRTASQYALSWDLLLQILNETKPYIDNPEQWYCSMQEYCRQVGQKNIRLKKKKLFNGAIVFLITAGVDILQNPLPGNNIGSELAWSAIKTTATFAAPTIARIFSSSDSSTINQQTDENDMKVNAVKHLLSQVSLLKKDLGQNNTP